MTENKHTKHTKYIVLAAGGTGGHIFPALAMAHVLESHGYVPILITDKRYEKYASEQASWRVHTISSSSTVGGFFKKAGAALQVGKGYFQAKKLLATIKPLAVVGFGGYPSFPTVYAAAKSGIPTIIHEQNSLLGQANHILAPYVDKIATSFPEVAGLGEKNIHKVAFTGNPVRAAIRAVHQIDYPTLNEHSMLHILIVGGSQGANVFSKVVPKAIELLPKELRTRIRIDQQCRTEDIDDVRAAYQTLGINADLATFFDDIPSRLAASHLVIGRAGASTIAEITVAGRPAILVPYPSAKDDHQTINANMLEERGGAWLMPQDAFTPETLSAKLKNMLQLTNILPEAASAIRKIATPNADERLLHLVTELVEKEG